jgi:hypothetical protein
MAYNPNFYNPYYQPPIQQQRINGLTFIDSIEQADMYQMPPGSVSQPLFLKDSNQFVIVTFDNVGGKTKELFSFTKEKIEDPNEAVTKADLEAFKADMMEAIYGKHAIPTTAAEPTATPAVPPAGPASRAV